MADETKSTDPPPREAARNALELVRRVADDDESDSDSAVTLAGYDPVEPPLSGDKIQWHVAHFEPSLSGAFAAAGWQRSLRVDRLYENKSSGRIALFRRMRDEGGRDLWHWCLFEMTDPGYERALEVFLGAEAVETCSNLHEDTLLARCRGTDGSIDASLLQDQLDAMQAFLDGGRIIADGLNYEPLRAALAAEERFDAQHILEGCRAAVERLWELYPHFRRGGSCPVPYNALDLDPARAPYLWMGMYREYMEAILKKHKSHGHRMFTGPQLTAVRHYLRRQGRMVDMVLAAYPLLPRAAAEVLCSPRGEERTRPEFQLDHYVAPVSDCIYTMVVMLSFPNASFGDNNRYLTKNLYGSYFVADCTREAVVQTFRSARAEQREA